MRDYASFEWDEVKRRANLDKHGLDFTDAVAVFDSNFLKLPALSIGSETRHRAVGYVGDVHVTVVYTERHRAIRIISMRKARDDERREHYQALHGR